MTDIVKKWSLIGSGKGIQFLRTELDELIRMTKKIVTVIWQWNNGITQLRKGLHPNTTVQEYLINEVLVEICGVWKWLKMQIL